MGMAPVAHVLFNKFMNFNPKNPDWLNRDRFVLSYVETFAGTSTLTNSNATIGSRTPEKTSRVLLEYASKQER